MLRLLAVGATLVMLVLKLLGQFDESWWIVFSPILGYIALGAVVGVCYFVAALWASK